jgi:hypothetical protein
MPALQDHFQPPKTESEGHVVTVQVICQFWTAEEPSGTAEVHFRRLAWQAQAFVLFRSPVNWRSDCCVSHPAFRLKISLDENKHIFLHVFPRG